MSLTQAVKANMTPPNGSSKKAAFAAPTPPATPTTRSYLSDVPVFYRVDVTPALAEEMLRHNAGNRSLRKERVILYTRLMLEDAWYLAPDAIGFSTAGRLLNAQHRLMAVVAAGRAKPQISVPFFVALGLHEKSQAVMDRGSRRTAADALLLSEGRAAPVAAAVAKTLLPYVGRADVTDEDVVEHVRAWHSTYEWVAATQLARKHPRASAPVLAALALVWTADKEVATQFAEKMVEPSDLPKGSPVLAAIEIAQGKVVTRVDRRRVFLRMLNCLLAAAEKRLVPGARYAYGTSRGLDHFLLQIAGPVT